MPPEQAGPFLHICLFYTDATGAGRPSFTHMMSVLHRCHRSRQAPFYTHDVCFTQMPQEQAGPFVPGSMGTAQGTAVSQVPSVVAEAEERQLGQDELPTDSMVSVAVLYSENPWSFFIVKCRATVERLTEQIG